MLLWDCTGNVITAQNNRRLFPMLSANVDDALSTVVATHAPLMDSKQLVSARLTSSYHNLIILMILLLNLRGRTCILPEGSHAWTRCMNLSWGSENVQGWRYTVVCLSMCVCVSMHAFKSLCPCVVLSTDEPNPAALTTTTPPDTENKGKIMENYLHKAARRTIISQTPQPEGAWLWRFIIAYWIIWINLTHLGLCVFPSSQLSRLFVSDNYTKWVISIWALSLFSFPM